MGTSASSGNALHWSTPGAWWSRQERWPLSCWSTEAGNPACSKQAVGSSTPQRCRCSHRRHLQQFRPAATHRRRCQRARPTSAVATGEPNIASARPSQGAQSTDIATAAPAAAVVQAVAAIQVSDPPAAVPTGTDNPKSVNPAAVRQGTGFGGGVENAAMATSSVTVSSAASSGHGNGGGNIQGNPDGGSTGPGNPAVAAVARRTQSAGVVARRTQSVAAGARRTQSTGETGTVPATGTVRLTELTCGHGRRIRHGTSRAPVEMADYGCTLLKSSVVRYRGARHAAWRPAWRRR